MAKKYSCKRSLLASVLILCLCFTSFVGTTFAWFTDSVTSANNIIKTGTLDVKLEYSVLEDGVWTDYAEVTKDTDVFGYNNWEPGYVAVAKFRITNAGTLALKYVLSADIYSETPGKNVDGEEFLLSDSLYTKAFALNGNGEPPTREQILAYTDGNKFNSDIAVSGSDMLPADDKDDTAAEHVVETALAIWMPTTVGNEANYREIQPSITFGINLIATQTANEEDSFGPDYDADAAYGDFFVNDEADFVSAAANAEDGDVILLMDDVTLANAVAIDEAVNIDLNGKTLSVYSLKLNNGGSVENGTIASTASNNNMVAQFGVNGGSLVMKDVTVEVNHHLLNYYGYSEAAGMEITNATAVLENCNIKINNQTKARWVFSYGLALIDASVTVNGGSITAECIEGTAANGPTNPNAVSSVGACTVTMNDVDVDAGYYAATVRGHLTINTTDTSVTSANVVDNNGGSHTINYINN